MIFDGRGFADKIAKRLRDEVTKLGRRPKLVTIVDPANVAGMKYSQLKAKMAERLGVEFQILNKSKILNLNDDPSVNGIMVQMPFPNAQELIKLIAPDKDVDGLREDSPFKPAVVRAVREILNSNIEILNKSKIQNSKIVIVGANGFVGRKLCNELRTMNYELGGLDIGDNLNQLKNVDIVISATGQAGLIKPEMVKNGFMAIDVGYPQPEFTPEALAKASFYTPVPGGVGPVTVVMLFANLLESCK